MSVSCDVRHIIISTCFVEAGPRRRVSFYKVTVIGDETLFKIENSNSFFLSYVSQFLIFKYLEGTNMFDAIDRSFHTHLAGKVVKFPAIFASRYQS